jgi:hypothetical protein
MAVARPFVMGITGDTAAFLERRRQFDALPKHAVIIGYDDGHTSRYRYFQTLEGRRPDIALETFGRLSPRYKGEVEVSTTGLSRDDLLAGFSFADRVTALDALAKKYVGRPLLLLFRDEAPGEFPSFRVERSKIDPRLWALHPRSGPARSEAPIAATVSLVESWYPGHVAFLGWGIRGLDRGESAAFAQPLQVGAAQVNGILQRGELFELSFVTRRLSADNRQYFAQFQLLDLNGQPLAAPELGFTAVRQVAVMDETTKTGMYRQDAFDFKVPGACPAGPVVLAVRLFAATTEVVGQYKGKDIHRMSMVEPDRPWAGAYELMPLGVIQVR